MLVESVEEEGEKVADHAYEKARRRADNQCNEEAIREIQIDRKSTRLNSSH